MITRNEAFALLKKYNKDPFHIQHSLTVEAVMKWYAKELGYADETEYWGIVGLLHDIDFELYPEEHCDMCGLCKVFHGKDPENAYDDYIKGIRTFADVSDDYKH